MGEMPAMTRAETEAPAPEVVDGRRRRGQDNRARIVAAMIDLVGEGQVSPSAEQVAARADVGLRTVFRHFQDMDSLYREMSGVIERELRAIVERPFLAQAFPDRLLEMIARRAKGFERIAPFRRAADAVRHRSRFLAGDAHRLATTMRELLVAELPPALAADATLVETLDLLMSFEAWSRLRRDQRLEPARAQDVVEAAVRRLISGTPGAASD